MPAGFVSPWTRLAPLFSFAVVTLLAPSAAAADLAVTAIRFWSLGDVTRIAVETTDEFEFRSERLGNPARIFFDLPGAQPRLGGKRPTPIVVNDTRLRQIRVAQNQPGTTRIVLDLAESAVEISTSLVTAPNRLLIEVKSVGAATPASEKLTFTSAAPKRAPISVSDLGKAPAGAKPVLLPEAPALTRTTRRPPAPTMPASIARVTKPVTLPSAPKAVPEPQEIDLDPEPADTASPSIPKAARRTANGDRTLTRMLGLKIRRVVLDPGHGGHDHGTTGPGGLIEKEVVLDVARRLGAIIEERLGSEVVYTRSKDAYLSLEERVAFANQRKADLFLSIHANSSPIRTASGAETYYLSFTPSRAAQEVAARENAASERSISELRDLITKIATQEKLGESREFALNVQSSLTKLTATGNNKGSKRDRGIKRAPFVVLIGASMPAILTEIGFVTNSKEEAMLKKQEYRQKLAEAIYRGVQSYADSLSQMEVAQSASHGPGH